MGWIKRNLFFVVGGLVAAVLLGGAGFFIWQGWSRNAEVSGKLNENYDTLQKLASQPVKPGDDKTDNTKLAREQEKEIRDWIAQSARFFQPIPTIPEGGVTSKTYATALGKTIYQLQQDAKDNSVNLPPQYYFSFQVQSSKLSIAPAGLDPLAAQLGEVKAIAGILFAARINALDSIQRVRVSDEDAQGLASDYTEQSPITNDLAVITPYVVTFRSFTPELARVVAGFATSPHPFIVKSLTVQPALGVSATPDVAAGGMPNPYNPYGVPGMVNPDARYRGMMPNPEMPPGMQPAPGLGGRGGLQTVLKEQLLHITLEVDIVKLRPKS